MLAPNALISKQIGSLMSERESPLNVRKGTGKHRHILQESPVRLNVKRQSSHLKFIYEAVLAHRGPIPLGCHCSDGKRDHVTAFGAKLEAAT